jgi:hypothetical protein
MSLRRRVILFYQQPQTLSQLKRWAGRDVEVVAAIDWPTLEATLRLYQKIDGFAAERSSAEDKSLDVMKLVKNRRPDVRRVLLVEQEAMAGVCEALHDKLFAQMLFFPLRNDELSRAFDVAPVAPAAVPRRAYPPLTGGIKASSSPAVNR